MDLSSHGKCSSFWFSQIYALGAYLADEDNSKTISLNDVIVKGRIAQSQISSFFNVS